MSYTRNSYFKPLKYNMSMMNKRQIKNEFNDKEISNNYKYNVTTKNHYKIKSSTEDSSIFTDELNINHHKEIQDLITDNGLIDHERKVNKLQQNLSIDTISKASKSNENNKNEIKKLEDKLAQSNARLYEYKNTCMSLRQEINKAQKIICNEIGENVTIASLSHNHNSSGWKGRSEQIQQLQHKITELQNKLKNDGRISRSSSVSFEQKIMINVDKDKRKNVENLSRELKQCEIILENNRKKLEAAKARIKVLENDLCLTRNNLILINEKKSHDEQLIEALNGQIRAIEYRYRDREMEIKNQRDKFQRDCVELTNELAAVKFQVEQLRKKIGERETEIITLKSAKSERICEYLSSNSSVQESSIDTKITAGFNDSNEYVILGLAAEAEQEKLLELVAVLNRRLDKERFDTDHISELLRCEKIKNAKIEKKLRQLEVERIKMSRTNTGYHAKFSKSLSGISSLKEQLNSDELNYKLELKEEECLALKSRLITVQQDKEMDLITYKKMLENTKEMFKTAFRTKITVDREYSTVTV